MMYSEFAEAVGCRVNAHNYEVFRNLEIMYMNSDMSKAEIYEYGKKLVDNSKTEEELKLEAEINAEIKEKKNEIVNCKADIERLSYYIGIETDEYWIRRWKEEIKDRKEYIRRLRNEIKALGWVLQ